MMIKRLGVLILAAGGAWAQLPTVPNTDFPTFRTNLNNSLVKGVNINTNYVNPTWITSLDWSKITNTPALGLGTVTSVAITGTAAQISTTGTCSGTTVITCTLSLPSVLMLPGTINKVTITAPATGATLRIFDGKTLTATNSVNFVGTDGSTITYNAGGTVSYIGVAETLSGDKTFTGFLNASGATHTFPAKVGSGVPAITCGIGEVFFSTTVSAGANLYFCTSTNIWTQMSGSGSGGASVFTGSIATATTGISGSAAAPILALTDQSLKSPVRFEIALTASTPVTSVTINNKTAGAKFSVAWTEPALNMTTVTYGGTFLYTCLVDTAASITTTQFFEIGVDGSTVNGTGCTTNHTGIESGPEAAACGTPASGNWCRYTDSSTHLPSAKTNNSATVYNMFAPPISPIYGGVGTANNAANTIAFSGNFGLTFTLSGTTNVQLPQSGTLAGATGTTTNPKHSLMSNGSAGSFTPRLILMTDLGASTWDVQTDAATVTWAIASVLNAQASLTFTVHSGSRTLNITNPVVGGFYTLKIIQDGTGGEGLTLGTGCAWKVSGGGSGAITPSTGAAAVDILSFGYDGTNCYANFNKNFN